MLRAFSTLGCPDLSLDQVIALALEQRVSGIELRSLGGTLDLPAYLAKMFGTPLQLAESMQGTRVNVVALDTSFKLIGDTREGREKLLAYVPWAEALGGVPLRVFDGGAKADDAEIGEAGETLRWWQGQRATRNWRTDLMVETHDSLFTATALRRFLQETPGCKILWDTHHTWKRGKEDPLITWETIHQHVVHIHVKDSISQASTSHEWTYVLPGTGEFPMERLQEAWRSERFTGPVSLEWEKLWHPYLGPLGNALTAAEAHGWW